MVAIQLDIYSQIMGKGLFVYTAIVFKQFL